MDTSSDHTREGTCPTSADNEDEDLGVTAAVMLEEDDQIETESLPVIELPADESKTAARNKRASADAGKEKDSSQQVKAAVVDLEAGDGCVVRNIAGKKEIIARPIDPNPPDSDTSSTFSSPPLRAEFISACVTKETEETQLGMELESQDGEILISSIAPGSIMANTPFEKGDRLLSVNSKRCYIMECQEIDEFIGMQVGNVTIVVHNQGGDPNMVESMVTRREGSRCGLGLKVSGRRKLFISSVKRGGLFFETLLTVGEPIVSINGENCETCDARDAAAIIDQAGKYVTVKARTLFETGLVVAAFSCTNSTGSVIPPELASPVEQSSTMQLTKTQLTAMALIAALLLIVIVGAGFLP